MSALHAPRTSAVTKSKKVRPSERYTSGLGEDTIECPEELAQVPSAMFLIAIAFRYDPRNSADLGLKTSKKLRICRVGPMRHSCDEAGTGSEVDPHTEVAISVCV